MALDNATVLENLRKQKADLETQMESAREMYLKVLGAIDVLEQIEKENEVEPVAETEVVE
jgi:hypothetical protein|tara:strand:- start:171 stop:350 length:180 start_codon:yes stop_codon:yes gene_type:complete